MRACIHPDGRTKHVRQACKVRALTSRALGILGQAANFAGGIFIGGIIVLFIWLMID